MNAKNLRILNLWRAVATKHNNLDFSCFCSMSWGENDVELAFCPERKILRAITLNYNPHSNRWTLAEFHPEYTNYHDAILRVDHLFKTFEELNPDSTGQRERELDAIMDELLSKTCPATTKEAV
jgi:hypothetical protein